MKINVDISKLSHKTYMEVHEIGDIEAYILQAIEVFVENKDKKINQDIFQDNFDKIDINLKKILDILSKGDSSQPSLSGEKFLNGFSQDINEDYNRSESRRLARKELLEKSIAQGKNKSESKTNNTDIEDAVEELARALDFFG